MTTAFRPAYLPLSTSTTLPDFIIFPILTRYYYFSVNNNTLLELALFTNSRKRKKKCRAHNKKINKLYQCVKSMQLIYKV